jgi:hypothetical protein
MSVGRLGSYRWTWHVFASWGLDGVPADSTILPNVERIKRLHVLRRQLKVVKLRIGVNPSGSDRLSCELVSTTGHEAERANLRKGNKPEYKDRLDTVHRREMGIKKGVPFLQRPSEHDLGGLPLVLVGERDEYWVIEFALQKGTVRLNYDVVLFAVLHNGTLLAERMNLAPNVSNL